MWSAIVLLPRLVANIRNGLASALAIGCCLYFLASLARARGKLAETKLLMAWGGWPTTIMLRHRDSSIDPVTKSRYHHALATMLGRPMPTAIEESANTDGADDIYRSATKLLIEARRGHAFQMIEDENASYGFRRNLFGLKSIAAGVALLAAITTALVWWASLSRPIDTMSIELSVKTYPHLPILLAADLGYLSLMAFMVNGDFVRQAANEYAVALLRTLDQPRPPQGTMVSGQAP
jgi:hypothetical protein